MRQFVAALLFQVLGTFALFHLLYDRPYAYTIVTSALVAMLAFELFWRPVKRLADIRWSIGVAGVMALNFLLITVVAGERIA